MRGKILRALREGQGNYVSGVELAARLGTSKVAIWKHIQTLRKEGYDVDSKPRIGYRLVAVPDLLLPYEVEDGLRTDLIGKEIHHYREIGSTQEAARGLAAEGAKEGTVVIAEIQTRGKGRRGRKWYSPVGGVYMSVILRPQISPARAPLLTLLAGVVVAKALRRLYNLKAELKWPNDVMVKDRKICGILTEMTAETEAINYCIVGIGVNANVELAHFPPEFRASTTSLKEELGARVSRVELVRDLLGEIERLYAVFKERGPAPILEEWKILTNTLGTQVQVIGQTEVVEGRAVDVDQDGALIIRLADGSLKRIIAGDLSLRRSLKAS
jgi:BirA family biotin operon repressor/biotin-[acetyl-CoA-carboxylase] ligase